VELIADALLEAQHFTVRFIISNILNKLHNV